MAYVSTRVFLVVVISFRNIAKKRKNFHFGGVISRRVSKILSTSSGRRGRGGMSKRRGVEFQGSLPKNNFETTSKTKIYILPRASNHQFFNPFRLVPNIIVSLSVFVSVTSSRLVVLSSPLCRSLAQSLALSPSELLALSLSFPRFVCVNSFVLNAYRDYTQHETPVHRYARALSLACKCGFRGGTSNLTPS